MTNEDKVRFKVDDGRKLFSNAFIEINSNMNVIIGGKSSGKSLLLYHIAKTVDPIQVEEKMRTIAERGYDLSKYPEFDFEVHWKDRQVDSLKADAESKVRQITYIPQMYINHLAEEKGEQRLKELIESILNQNEDFQIFLENEKTKIQDANLKISATIDELFVLRENYSKISFDLKSIGDKTAIQANIDKIKRDIDELRKKAGFTPEENKLYEYLILRRESLRKRWDRYNLYLSTFKEYSIFINDLRQSATESFSQKMENLEYQLSDDQVGLRIAHSFTKSFVRETEQHFETLKGKYSQLENKVSAKIDKLILEIKKLDQALEPFLTKITNQNLLKKFNEDLVSEIQKQKQIDEREKEQREIGAKGKSVKQSLIDDYGNLFQMYKNIVLKLSAPELGKIGSDLELKSNLGFNTKAFMDGFGGLLDGRSNFKTSFGSCFNDKNEYEYSSTDHLNNIQEIFDKIWSSEKYGIKFKSGFDMKDACYKLFEDYFIFKYTIKQNNDDILSMSPGKRGLVLLQLILHLSNAIHPILIDQPEDNLDNRTIFNELNEFIKGKKIQRQIIIVTHNANLVVSTDSEQVIVANQQGQDQGKENKEYTFEYVSGALEYSFKDPNQNGILYKMGIREHVCDILEGGENAFKRRELKYGF